MKLIGRFARDNKVTIKALHHYEKLGLIIPSKIDSSNGYRYYDDSSIETLDNIKILKNLGFSLNEIRSILLEEFDLDKFKDQLKGKEMQSALEVDEGQKKHNLILNFMKSLEVYEENIGFKEVMMLENKSFRLDDKALIKNDGRREFSIIADSMFENQSDNTRTVCALKVDLDDFSKINEVYGFDIGDIVLKETANVIASVVYKGARKNYAVYERAGGDEFSILLTCNLKEAELVAKEILEGIKDIDFGEVERELKITTTIGISESKVEPNTINRKGISILLMDASMALYELKKKDLRGRYLVFTEK